MSKLWSATPAETISVNRNMASMGIWLRLFGCTMLIRKRLDRQLRRRFNITHSRCDALAALSENPVGPTLGSVSRRLLVSPGAVTALVRRLADAGYVKVELRAGDRRSSLVSITAAGARYYSASAEALVVFSDHRSRGRASAAIA